METASRFSPPPDGRMQSRPNPHPRNFLNQHVAPLMEEVAKRYSQGFQSSASARIPGRMGDKPQPKKSVYWKERPEAAKSKCCTPRLSRRSRSDRCNPPRTTSDSRRTCHRARKRRRSHRGTSRRGRSSYPSAPSADARKSAGNPDLPPAGHMAPNEKRGFFATTSCFSTRTRPELVQFAKQQERESARTLSLSIQAEYLRCRGYRNIINPPTLNDGCPKGEKL